MKQQMTNIEKEAQVWEKIETIYPETIQVPNYDYGASQNTLDYDIALRNKPTIPTQNIPKYWIFTINNSWTKTITWVWFTPTIIIIKATQSNSDRPVNSDWLSDWTNQSCHYIYHNSWWATGIASDRSTTRIIYLYSNSHLTDAYISSVNNDWFVLTIPNYYYNAECSYICF